jgi:predicted dehydrogenase
MDEKALKLAIVGCGAVVEQRHLPALRGRGDCQVTALADPNLNQVRRLAEEYQVSRVLADYHELLADPPDAAIVAVPNASHAPVSIDLLKAGVHVLVEKPMALRAADCEAMIHAAQSGNAVLAVGMPRRFIRAARFVKWAVETELLGKVLRVDIRDGFVFAWPLRSDFFFRREISGGGTLIDSGVHSLDQLLWWFGEIKQLDYCDDNFGGVEADCLLRLTFHSGVEGTIEFSRTRNLRNTAIIRGEQGELEVALWKNSLVLRYPGAPLEVRGEAAAQLREKIQGQTNVDFIAAEQEDFFQAIRDNRPPEVSGEDGMQVVRFVETCYQKRQPLDLSWLSYPRQILTP